MEEYLEKAVSQDRNDFMAPLAQETVKYSEQEEKLFRELDKGIDDMEQGNTIPHEEAMRQIRERLLKEYAI